MTDQTKKSKSTEISLIRRIVREQKWYGPPRFISRKIQ